VSSLDNSFNGWADGPSNGGADGSSNGGADAGGEKDAGGLSGLYFLVSNIPLLIPVTNASKRSSLSLNKIMYEIMAQPMIT
jgi:hypothetical protein